MQKKLSFFCWPRSEHVKILIFFKNCFDLMWEKYILVIEKTFCKFETKGWKFAKFWRSLAQFIQTVKSYYSRKRNWRQNPTFLLLVNKYDEKNSKMFLLEIIWLWKFKTIFETIYITCYWSLLHSTDLIHWNNLKSNRSKWLEFRRQEQFICTFVEN